MLIHIEQDYDITKAIHRTNIFTASLKKGQFLNLQVNSTLESTMTYNKQESEKSERTTEVHTYSYTIMVYYDEEGEPQVQPQREYPSFGTY